MSSKNHIPDTVAASLDARLAPFRGLPRAERTALEDLDVEVSRCVTPRQERHLRLGIVNDLKLLFAALGAGGSAVPLGDNSRQARLLSEYAAALRQQ
ncbi:MAG TPA: hypothetical protein VGO61_13380 [Steroidobacteraceae bacterium]|jgi:hypothetical protein|nr:hypothetical protein [Steroidobacteraceae bacterium]